MKLQFLQINEVLIEIHENDVKERYNAGNVYIFDSLKPDNEDLYCFCFQHVNITKLLLTQRGITFKRIKKSSIEYNT